MPKKVVDILPSKSPVTFQEEKPVLIRKKVGLSVKSQQKVVGGKKGLLLIPLALVAVGLFLYFNLSRAEIEIWPETEIKSFQTKLTVDKRIENINFSANLIPGVIFEEEKTFSQEFPSSGKKLIEKKAEGVIRVFNDSQKEQVLVAQTRFQPPIEKFRSSLENGENPWFRTTERIIVPPRSYKDVKVVADAPGEKYNIEPSTFSIPGLVGHPQYTFVYGKSLESMKGGFKKEIPEVTQEDLKEAERLLKEKTLKEIKDVLKDKIPSGFIFLEKATKTEILATSSLVNAGTEIEKFKFQIKAKITGLSFKKEDLENFSKEFIVSKIPDDKKIDQKSLKIDYLPGTIDLEAEKIPLSLNLETKIYSDIDEISLKRAISEKSLKEAQFFLQNQPQINRAKVKIWPFWVKRIPQEPEKIKLKMSID